MLLTVLKSKLHRVKVTDANIDYVGSITIDQNWMDAAGIIEGEQVHVVDVTNGARLVTYAIPGPRGSKCICLNGAAARLVSIDDIVIIIAYAQVTPDEARSFKPTVVIP
ncbi:MAG: aspartate 1-decarboxylase [Bacteroidaceae bacterium]|nr:aspartate 1-decarboxylase [Bacteroidaceae bacterium]